MEYKDKKTEIIVLVQNLNFFYYKNSVSAPDGYRYPREKEKPLNY